MFIMVDNTQSLLSPKVASACSPIFPAPSLASCVDHLYESNEKIVKKYLPQNLSQGIESKGFDKTQLLVNGVWILNYWHPPLNAWLYSFPKCIFTLWSM